jgi:ATP:ADP antiporter, AAA family
MKFALGKVLNIKSGEEGKVGLLLIYSFFIGITLALFYTASNTLFLQDFQAKDLPYVYILSGIIGYALWFITSRLKKYLSGTKLIIAYLLLLLFSFLFFGLGVQLFPGKSLSFAMLIWFGVLLYIKAVAFWGVAGRLFDLQQGKRLFGLITSGEVISGIIAFFSIPLMMKSLKPEDLVIISFFSISIALSILLLSVRVYSRELKEADKAPKESISKNSRNSFFTMFRNNPYFALIFILAVLPMFGVYFIDYFFLAQTKEVFADSTFLAGFLGVFMGSVSIIELAVKSFLTGNVMKKYGLKTALILLPFLLIVSTLLVVISGTFMGTAGIFFSFIALGKLLERILRTGFYEPAFQLLYQPLPANERISFQNNIEGVPKALGNIVAGSFLLLFTLIAASRLVLSNVVFLIILVFWFRMVIRMAKEYRNTINNMIKKTATKKKTENKSLKIKKTLFDIQISGYTDIEKTDLKKIFDTSGSDEIQMILEYIRKNYAIESVALLKELFENPVKGISGSYLQEIISELEKAEDYSFGLIQKLAASRHAEDRFKAAALLRFSGRYASYKLLLQLLRDPEEDVRKRCMISAARIRRIELWPLIIEHLADDACFASASKALEIIGEPVLSDLESFFQKMESRYRVQIRIIRLYARIGGQSARFFLRNKIAFMHEEVRENVLIALSALNYKAEGKEKSTIKQYIEQELKTLLWFLAARRDIEKNKNADILIRALNDELKQQEDQIFFLLGLLYDHQFIRQVQKSLFHENESRVFALEIIETTLSEDLRELFKPLVDSSDPQDIINNYRDLFPQEEMPFSRRLHDIINKDYSRVNRYTKACAIKLLDNTKEKDIISILKANLVNPDPLIREEAQRKLRDISLEEYNHFLETLSVSANYTSLYADLVLKNPIDASYRLPDIMEILKKSPVIKNLKEAALLQLAEKALHRKIQNADEFSFSQCFYISIAGNANLLKKNNNTIISHPSLLISTNIITKKQDFQIEIHDTLEVLEINMKELFALMKEDIYFKEIILSYYDEELEK